MLPRAVYRVGREAQGHVEVGVRERQRERGSTRVLGLATRIAHFAALWGCALTMGEGEREEQAA